MLPPHSFTVEDRSNWKPTRSQIQMGQGNWQVAPWLPFFLQAVQVIGATWSMQWCIIPFAFLGAWAPEAAVAGKPLEMLALLGSTVQVNFQQNSANLCWAKQAADLFLWSDKMWSCFFQEDLEKVYVCVSPYFLTGESLLSWELWLVDAEYLSRLAL